ncbi:MAG TPA: amidohydrolase family protein [Actinopolymorphaceae bacterium]|nr:amidohydrolase family protein [Actinopolymorphaceae bacterium]
MPYLFDANAMVGKLAGEPGGSDAAGLVAALARVGVGEAVVSHVRAWQNDPKAGNRQLVVDLASTPCLRPCWVVLPDTCGELGGIDVFLAAATGAGVVATRAFPADHGYRLDGADFAPVLAGLERAGLPLIVDADQTSWAHLEAVAARYRALTFVACTIGYRALRRVAGVLARTDNILVDLSYLGTHLGLEWLVERFGPGRLLFGTGAPRRDPADAVTRLLWSELPAEAISRIGAGNLRQLVGTPTPAVEVS